jgi:hypothetical protein
MPNPTTASRAKSLKALVAWAGPCASFLCLIHCIAMGFVAVLAPSFLTVLPHDAWVEVAVLVIAVVSGFFSLRRLNAAPALKNAFNVFAVMSSLALVIHSHPLFHGGLVAMSAFQVYLLGRHSMARKAPCCDLEH